MSIIRSLGTDSERLLLSEMHEVENLQERMEEIAERIASHPSLTYAAAYSNRDIEDPRIFNAVISNPNIKALGLYGCVFDSSMLVRILRMPSLESLQLSAPRFEDVEAAARAIQCHGRKLKTFKCSGVRGDGHGDILVEAVAKSLRFRSSLTTLYFCGCRLGQDSLCAIANVLQGHSSLEKVSIVEQRCDLSEGTSNAFALAIEQNTSLKELSLDVGTIPPVGSQRLLESLTRNQALTRVEIGGVTSDDTEVSSISSASAGNNSSLKMLTLGASKTPGGTMPQDASRAAVRGMVGPLVLYLDSFCSLTTLQLEAWEYSTDGLEALCNKLLQNESVEALHLTRTRFDSEKARILCRFVANDNETLSALHLSHCSFDDADTAALCESLKRNEMLTRLFLLGNKMSNRILMHLAGLVESNTTLEELMFWDDSTRTSDEGMVRFGEALKKNLALKRLFWMATIPPSTETHFYPLLDALKHHRKLQLDLIGACDNATESRKDEIKFYNARNAHLCPLLSAEPPLPLGVWPRVFRRAGTSQASQNANLNMLHFLVKEKCDLFQRARDGTKSKVTASKRKRTRDAAGARRRSKRGRS